MSHYDFPRINFYGHCLLDPATANNGFYVPLVIYDPLNVNALLPPRIYLTKSTLKECVTIEDIKKILPSDTCIQTDKTGRLKGTPYLEITPINSVSVFHDWAVTPLGEFEADKEYIPIYENVVATNTQTSLMGAHPGYWNYYGQQKVSFDWDNGSFIEHVEVSSIATGLKDSAETIYVMGDQQCPADVQALLGTTVSLNELPEDTRTHTAVMTDLDPTFALYTQVFNDSFGVFRDSQPLMKGKPFKFSMRFPNVFRVVNEIMPNSGSGDFISAIPLDAMDDPDASEVIALMKTYGDPARIADLQGVFIRFNMLEVQENRPPDYNNIGKGSNPARVTIAGSIGPWFKGEMRSLVMGRQLIPDQPFKADTHSTFAPCILKHDVKNQVVTLDALNMLPLYNTDLKEPGSSPPSNSNTKYETYPLEDVHLILKKSDGSSITLASTTVNSTTMPRDPFLRSGGMLHFKCTESLESMQDGLLELHGQDADGCPIRLMKEAEYMINTDEAGLYTNQGDDPSQGYVSYGYPKSHCRLRIFSKGIPVQKKIPITVQENMVTAHGGNQGTKIFRHSHYKDGDIITFPTRDVANAMYLITPGHLHTAMNDGQIQGQIIATGSFVSIRILPKQDYAKYLDPSHPEYPTKVTWLVLEEEVFNTIKMIYPAMNNLLPLTAENWDNSTMASKIVERIDEANWSSFHYMPPTRDLSDAQRLLIYKWAADKNVAVPLVAGDNAPDDTFDFSYLTDKYMR